MIFSFLSPPPHGTVVMLDEQAYELSAIEPYTRKDGAASSLLRWDTACPVCGVGFSVTTGLSARELTRRCLDHRKPSKPVKGKRSRRLNVQIIEP